MSWIINKKYICILLLFTSLIDKVKNSYVLCDDEDTACPSNYICCKRDKGYICCYQTMTCCNKGESCCKTGFLSELKNNQEKPKIGVSLLEIRNHIENNKNSTISIIPEDTYNIKGLIVKIYEFLEKIKAFINKNLRQQKQEGSLN